MTVNRRTMLWVAAALLGIAATATVAWSASQLAATRVGLAGDPLSVTSGLAPATTSAPAHARTPAAPRPSPKPHRRFSHATATSSTASAPTPLPVTPSPPVTRAPAPSAPVTTVAPSTTGSTLSPTRHKSATQRDDSGGDGSANSHHGPDD